MADNYLLRVTGGPSYDPSTHKPVPVNSSEPFHVSNSVCEANINVRIQNYRGLPHGSPQTSPYFSQSPHTHDQYSLSFTILPKSPIPGHQLLFGNDFDHPIRDRLPPGFGKAFQIVKWWIDPGIDGDVYADEPYLYGPALSSLNVLRIGEKAASVAAEPTGDDKGSVSILEEGADGPEAEKIRQDKGLPADGAARKKWFLDEAKRKEWEFEAGRLYHADFFNPYLDFNEFALKLPGFSLPIIKYWDGQPLRSHSVRYVLKNKETSEVYFVLVFALVPIEEAEKEKSKEEKSDGKTAEKTAEGGKSFEPRDDDLD
ncbi:MAG: hypothetical protein M4579_000126 [Chaenotheca gracillima]|nr:MAG: hypothetical protein M4579_000126 [Chaenotheca gracillima]